MTHMMWAVNKLRSTHPQQRVPPVMKLERVQRGECVNLFSGENIEENTFCHAPFLARPANIIWEHLTFHHSKVKGDGYDALKWHVVSSDGHPPMGINKDSTKHCRTNVSISPTPFLNVFSVLPRVFHLQQHMQGWTQQQAPLIYMIFLQLWGQLLPFPFKMWF